MSFDRSKPPIGFPLLPLPDADGRLRYPTHAESVRQQIQIILSTRPGEQLMRPSYGGGLESYLHQPNSLTTRQAIHDTVLESITRWEPRAVVERVAVDPVQDEPGQVRIEVIYRLQRTGEYQQIGITMELEG